jgi:hypothetical protein
VQDGWKIRILVLDRGFVKVCRCPDPHGYAFWLPYEDGRTIRVWGTTEGLGQLVKGPTSMTVLDALVPTGSVPVRAIVDIIDVEQDKWEQRLTPTSSKVATRRRDRSS